MNVGDYVRLRNPVFGNFEYQIESRFYDEGNQCWFVRLLNDPNSYPEKWFELSRSRSMFELDVMES